MFGSPSTQSISNDLLVNKFFLQTITTEVTRIDGRFWSGWAALIHFFSFMFLSRFLMVFRVAVQLTYMHGRYFVNLLWLIDSFRTLHPGCLSWGALGVNKWSGGQAGDWAFQIALMYNRKLQISEILAMESWILSMQGGFTPAHLQVMFAACYFFWLLIQFRSPGSSGILRRQGFGWNREYPPTERELEAARWKPWGASRHSLDWWQWLGAAASTANAQR